MSKPPYPQESRYKALTNVVYELRFGMQLLIIFSFCVMTGQLTKQFMNQTVLGQTGSSSSAITLDPRRNSAPETQTPNPMAAQRAEKLAKLEALSPAPTATPAQVKAATQLRRAPRSNPVRRPQYRPRPALQYQQGYRTAAYTPPKPKQRNISRAKAPTPRKPTPAARQVQSVLRNDYGVSANRSYDEYMGWVNKTLKEYQKK